MLSLQDRYTFCLFVGAKSWLSRIDTLRRHRYRPLLLFPIHAVMSGGVRGENDATWEGKKREKEREGRACERKERRKRRGDEHSPDERIVEKSESRERERERELLATCARPRRRSLTHANKHLFASSERACVEGGGKAWKKRRRIYEATFLRPVCNDP